MGVRGRTARATNDPNLGSLPSERMRRNPTMATQDELPEDDTLTPPASQTGGIPLGMQAGAKAGGDVVDSAATTPAGMFGSRSDELNDAALDDPTGRLSRVAGSEAEAIGGSSIGDTGGPTPPAAGGDGYDAPTTDPHPPRHASARLGDLRDPGAKDTR
jgi:hypothetical protein